LSRNAADRDAELNWLKTLVKQLADKVNAPGDTPVAHIAAVEDRVDEVVLHGVRLGTTLGLAAMATHTGVDYSTQPCGFQGGTPEDVDEIEVILERLDGHDDTIADFYVCIVMIPFCLWTRILLFLNEFENFILAEHAKTPAPWHRIHRKSSIREP
jgi:hypothetical protein